MKKLGIVMLGLVLLGAGCLGGGGDVADTVRLEMPNGKKVSVEVARTRDEQFRGLSGREKIQGGMLFCMGKTKVQSFWMNGMKVPIDMIWIHGGEVRGVDADVPLLENEEITRRSSVEPVNMVLELPAGDAERFDVETDTFIEGAVEACG